MKCKNCGKCCAGILLLSPEEIKNIKDYIRENNIKIVNRQSVLQNYIDVCPFLSRDNKCNIYDVRPDICRRYQCYDNPDYDLQYEKIELVNMQKEFFPEAYCPEVNLQPLRQTFETNKQKLVQKGKKNV